MDKNLKKLRKLFAVLDEDTLTRAEFVDAFENVVNLVLEMKKRNMESVDMLENVYNDTIKKLKDDQSISLSEIKKAVSKSISKQIDEFSREIKTKLSDVDRKMKEVKDGKDADEEKIIKEVEKRIPKPKDGSPDKPEEVRDKLERLRGDNRLDSSAIKGLKDLTTGKHFALVGGTRGIALYIDGTKKGFIKTINLIAGTGITLIHTLSNGRNDILIDGTSGSGFTLLPATGSINGVNTAFTFTAKPTYIILDGAWYKENKGWTWNASTLTATMIIPPNDDIYGFN